MYLHGKAPTLEPASPASREFAEKLRSKVMTDVEQETIKELMLKSGIVTDTPIKPKKKKKKGGPNPLSCKKAKKKENPITNEKSNVNKVKETGKIRKRKRVKIPSHLKKALVE